MKARSQTAAVDCGRNTDRLLNKFNEVVMVEVLEMEIWVGCLHFGLMLEQLSKWWTVLIFSALVFQSFASWTLQSKSFAHMEEVRKMQSSFVIQTNKSYKWELKCCKLAISPDNGWLSQDNQCLKWVEHQTQEEWNHLSCFSLIRTFQIH